MIGQLLAHLWGDYILQSDWMAQNKVKAWMPALVHAMIYSLVFLLFHPSLLAWFVIFSTHALIDRFRLARYVTYLKNWLSPKFERPPGDVSRGGFSPEMPPYMAFWLLIIVDNTMHLTINYLALQYL